MAKINKEQIESFNELKKSMEKARYFAEKLREALDKLSKYNINIPLIIEEIDETE